MPVSYTHLDVYKRQASEHPGSGAGGGVSLCAGGIAARAFFVASLPVSPFPAMLGIGSVSYTHLEQFNVKDYGYTTLARFVESVEGLEIRPNRAGNRVVQLKK